MASPAKHTELEARFHRVPLEPELVQVSLIDPATNTLHSSERLERARAEQLKAKALLTGMPIKEYRDECKPEDKEWAVKVLKPFRRRSVLRKRNHSKEV